MVSTFFFSTNYFEEFLYQFICGVDQLLICLGFVVQFRYLIKKCKPNISCQFFSFCNCIYAKQYYSYHIDDEALVKLSQRIHMCTSFLNNTYKCRYFMIYYQYSKQLFI